MTESNTKPKERVEAKVGPPLIQTFEDAREAYLREEIDLQEFERLAGKYGHAAGLTNWIPSRLEKPDTYFHRDLPEGFYDQPQTALPTVDEQLKIVEEKNAVRDAAAKAAEKVVADVKPEISAAEAQNAASRKAAEKPQEALDNTLGEVYGETPSSEKKK